MMAWTKRCVLCGGGHQVRCAKRVCLLPAVDFHRLSISHINVQCPKTMAAVSPVQKKVLYYLPEYYHPREGGMTPYRRLTTPRHIIIFGLGRDRVTPSSSILFWGPLLDAMRQSLSLWRPSDRFVVVVGTAADEKFE